MDPVTLIVGALAAGAATGLTDTATQAIKDGYAALKAWVGSRYPGVSTAGVEKKPEEDVRRASLESELRDEDAGSDEELVKLAKALLAAVEESKPAPDGTTGLILRRVWADTIDAEDIEATGGGTAVDAEDVTVKNFKMKNIKAHGTGSPSQDRP